MALFHVRMDVQIPHDMPELLRRQLVAQGSAYAQQLQRAGTWVHLWRIVGRYSNISIFDVDSNDELEAVLTGLPLYPYTRVEVMALAQHPSDISGSGPPDGAGSTGTPG